MSSKPKKPIQFLDPKLHTQLVRTNPITLKKETIDLITDKEQWDRVVNAGRIRAEWNTWLNKWLRDYEYFLTLHEGERESFYSNFLALSETMIYNYRNWVHIGVNVHFKELAHHHKYMPIMTEHWYNRWNKLNPNSSTILKESGDICKLAYRDKMNALKVKGEELPTLEENNYEPSKEECYTLLDKCLNGDTEIENKIINEELVRAERVKVYFLTGQDQLNMVSKSMRKWKSLWLKELFDKRNTDREEHYKRFAKILVKRKIVPQIDLIAPLLSKVNKPNEELVQIFANSFIAFWGKGMPNYQLTETSLGNRGARQLAFMVVPKEYSSSQTYIYQMRTEKI
ncbi:MAG: hypothetical protein HOL62_03320 [Candidatus Marinimicrobia bacterium]|jgi:hypothetical protein|nr:hypothetical protein [Candidatus Neomarinimicrobiota bacterium]MBT3944760.1 hypothetical protein [Candidatus Neomarinimicrobiota bacterium]MBT4925912.1 hypothetical protein [Candidatus Neomarinimicrobiota bacterium]MBT5251716.1 hypothetical protein [Candidatus Neomarinimicrobiota bacterium]MBT5490130.1 hypothetical protein [Candidatus Neomarinimicrobiota bacterium]